jgi:uncharacterized protein (TIGR02246 family)
MVRSQLPVVVALALALSACVSRDGEDSAAQGSLDTAAETDLAGARQALEQLDRQWEAATNRGDAAGAANLYADDAYFMAPNAAIVQGRQNIQQTIQGFVDAGAKNVQFTTVAADANGDLAYEVGRYTLDMQPQGAAQAVTDTGKYVIVARRQSDGTWKIVADIFNTDLPAPGASQ